MKISFHTFGCKCNLYDSNQIASFFCDDPFFEVAEGEIKANIHVINTCTVTSSADAQARNLIRHIDKNNRDSLIVVIGCSVRGNSNDYLEITSELKNNSNRFLVIDNMKEDVISSISNQVGRQISGITRIVPAFRTRASVKITDGCNNFCSYCIVPFVRGREKSRSIDDIVREIKNLESNDIKEVIITGISIGDYSFGLENLLEELLKSTQNIRFRISSLRPSKISEKLIELMKIKRVCPHVHVSLQSASDKVLKLMNRLDYTAQSFSERIKYFHKKLDHRDPFIAADVIVGFPGEGEKEFKETLEILNDIPMNKLHVFTFSPRPGTKAYDMKKENDGIVRKRRDILLEFSDQRYKSSLKNMVGKNVEILWESETDGHTENYYPVCGAGKPNKLESHIIKLTDGNVIKI
ncbi:MAG: MiaB/RimO family radical SAM methylthiotransferase [Proteobacteria bacterium]|nr:MiaB/RimO family radical SAM methylthiotransferase [Pseudomonadota bacterium]